jgi:succinyl-CoA synthetase beta subunit
LRAIAAAAAAQAHPRSLDEHGAKELLARHGIAVPHGRVVVEAAGAVEAARSIGYPVVLKLIADDVIHKSDVGGVVVGVESDEGVVRECSRLLGLATEARVLVEQMVPSGVEIIVAARRDGVVPTLTVGLGGVWTEVLADVVCVPLPASPERVRAALGELRGSALLAGARGGAAYDVDSLSDAASHIGDVLLVEGLGLIEVNPIVVGESSCVAVDAVVA